MFGRGEHRSENRYICFAFDDGAEAPGEPAMILVIRIGATINAHECRLDRKACVDLLVAQARRASDIDAFNFLPHPEHHPPLAIGSLLLSRWRKYLMFSCIEFCGQDANPAVSILDSALGPVGARSPIDRYELDARQSDWPELPSTRPLLSHCSGSASPPPQKLELSSKEKSGAALSSSAAPLSADPGGFSEGIGLDSDGTESNVTDGSLSPEGRELITTPSETERDVTTAAPDAGANLAAVVTLAPSWLPDETEFMVMCPPAVSEGASSE
jgi:hypothetical protein